MTSRTRPRRCQRLSRYVTCCVDGVDLTEAPYSERRKRLSQPFRQSPRIELAEQKIVRSVDELEKFFELAISEGAEGLVCR